MHCSVTDPEARLYRKGDGQPATLCYMGHVLMENCHGLVVGGAVTLATGRAERQAALELLDRPAAGQRRMLAADKAYDVADFTAISGSISRGGTGCSARIRLGRKRATRR